ncbi:MAG: glucosaminidase domain-containing protein [Candidatus Cryptobacteroides sp.]
MKRFLICIFSLLGLWTLCSAQTNPKEEYIKKYSHIAVSEMKRTGVPASITLAQGLLESGAGKSRLATEANNHFGIKCHKNWTGKTISHDDDAKGECFRAYDKAEESFRDHSDFLRYNDRYKFLFDYEPSDYKSWCYGLKKAGYATDPNYATKLIGIVEDFNLTRFDNVKVEVESPDKLEKPVEVPSRELSSITYNEEYVFEVSRPVYKMNGVDFVYAMAGDSFASLAQQYSLFLKEILSFNDLKESVELLPGDMVYLKPKRNKSPKGLDMYIVSEDGEDLWKICQRFGVKMSKVMKLNNLTSNSILVKDQELRLR